MAAVPMFVKWRRVSPLTNLIRAAPSFSALQCFIDTTHVSKLDYHAVSSSTSLLCHGVDQTMLQPTILSISPNTSTPSVRTPNNESAKPVRRENTTDSTNKSSNNPISSSLLSKQQEALIALKQDYNKLVPRWKGVDHTGSRGPTITSTRC